MILGNLLRREPLILTIIWSATRRPVAGLNGKPLSRVFKLEDRGEGQRAPIVFQVSQGPGEVVGEGAIKPAGKPTVEIAMLLTRWQARRLGHALQAYLQAWETAQMISR